MASGETLCKFKPQDNEPQTGSGRRDTRNNHPTIDLALTEIMVVSDIMPRNYAGTTGITINMHIAMSSATANDIKLEGSLERIGEVQNLDSDGFAAAQNTGDITVPGTSGDIDIIPVTFTDGAQMDSIAVGEGFRLKVERVVVVGTDATGDLEIRFIEIKET